jgi:uncharacterized membrane protein
MKAEVARCLPWEAASVSTFALRSTTPYPSGVVGLSTMHVSGDRTGCLRRWEANVTIFHAVLTLATLLCSLVAGLLFAFAVVIMPGIRSLDDRGFIRAFQAIDRVIQNGQPLFMFGWVGSALAVIAAAVLGMWEVSGSARLFIIVATLLYVLGVQLPTVVINIPLNNEMQKLDPDAMDEPTRLRARAAFEARWNRWNAIRTACASLASVVLMLALMRV